jgi:hypothetical protein
MRTEAMAADQWLFGPFTRDLFSSAMPVLGAHGSLRVAIALAVRSKMYAEILSIEWQARLRAFRDYLKSVMFRNIENIHQGLVEDIADLSTVLF